ncbi:hypothetical protein PFISCL1PPCAC_250, partial [Pristionchus fissidentatus]
DVACSDAFGDVCYIQTSNGTVEKLPFLKIINSRQIINASASFIENSFEVKVHDDFLISLRNTSLRIDHHESNK